MINFRTVLISCLFLLITFPIVQSIQSQGDVEIINKNLVNFPHNISNFNALDIELENVVMEELDPDIYIFRKYSNQSGQEVILYIGYYGTKKGGRTGHNPEACYPGSGWAILKKSKVEIPVFLKGRRKILKLNSLRVKKSDVSKLVYYWYQANGDEVLSSGVMQNLCRARSKILYNRNDGAFIRVSTPLIGGLSYTEKRLNSFINDIFPLIVKYWPEERGNLDSRR